MWRKMSPFFKVVIYFLGIPLSPVVKWDYEILRYKFWWIPLVISLDQKHGMPIGISTQEAKKILKIIDQEICDCKPLLWLAHFIRRKRQEYRWKLLYCAYHVGKWFKYDRFRSNSSFFWNFHFGTEMLVDKFDCYSLNTMYRVFFSTGPTPKSF